jgi:hypothetical protein
MSAHLVPNPLSKLFATMWLALSIWGKVLEGNYSIKLLVLVVVVLFKQSRVDGCMLPSMEARLNPVLSSISPIYI